MKHNEKGFTLIEILVVVIIIGVLSAIAIPGYLRSMEKTKAAGAMQALADIAKAEHDYYAVQSEYTNDFGDLVLTMTDENTMDDADNSSYGTKHFVYNLQSNLDAATASRVGGDAPYTLYRLFDDPRIYCQPAGNKYCEMLDLPAGTFTTSIGSWQSCEGGVYPCTKACARNTKSGYTCTGTYNEDGTFSERVCTSTAVTGDNICVYYDFDEEGNKRKVSTCIPGENVCNIKRDNVYDEDGNLTYWRYCKTNNADGSCNTYESSRVEYTYDSNGNQLTARTCKTVDEDGSCSAYYNSRTEYSYDANGNMLTQRNCSTVAADGSCSSYSDGYDYTYDANGNMLTQRRCDTVKADGTCTRNPSWQLDRDYTYDENGNQLTQRVCGSLTSDGSKCKTYYGGYAFDYTYDENGRKLTSRTCRTIASNGTCTAYNTYDNYDYIYDSNGNNTVQRKCQTVQADGSCSAYASGSYSGTIYTYDASGNVTSEFRCTSWGSDGNCTAYHDSGLNREYAYDENGTRISYRTCNTVSGMTCTSWSGYVSNP